MPSQRPLLKRAASWTAALLLLIAGYVLGAPFAILLIARHCPAALPIIDAAFAPLHVYANDTALPGSAVYVSYADWCQRQFQDDLIYDPFLILP